MIIYFIILFLSIFPFIINKRSKVSFILSSLILILFAGFRSKLVGTDSGNYARMIVSEKVKNSQFFSGIGSLEIGYSLILKLVSLISNKYSLLFLFIAIIVVYAYYIVIKNLSFDFKISLFIYITLGTYLFFFNGARQGLAAALYGFAILQLIKGNFKKYLIWVIIASLFHKSVLFTIPFYYILRSKFSIRKFILLFLFSFILMYSLSSIINLFPKVYAERYYNYLERNQTGAVLLTIYHVILLLFFIMIRKYISINKLFYYDIYLNMTAISTIIFLVVVLTGKDVNFVRLTLYFALGYILIWPIIIKDVKFFYNPIIKFLFYLIHIFFFYIYINKMSNLVPYYFNPNLF